MKPLKRESSQPNSSLVNLRVVRVALFGARGVGKSAIAKQFVYNEFDPEEELSMVEVYQKQAVINGEPLILEILDTGQDLNSPIVDQYFAGSDGYLLVFSLWDMDSLSVVSEARSRIRQARLRGDNFDDAFRIPMILVGNKKDLLDDGRISSEVFEYAQTFSLPLITTSAWTGEGIQEAFTAIIAEIDERNTTNVARSDDGRLNKLSKQVFSTCRLKEQISIALPKSQSQCFRILNGTHQAGCQSEKSGNIGTVVVFHHNFEETIALFEKHDEPMIAMVKFADMDPKITKLLHSSDIIKGILLHGQPGSFSEDSVCPAKDFSLYNESTCQQWNANSALHKDGFRFLDWNKPIFIIDNPEEEQLLLSDCYEEFNKPLIDPAAFPTVDLRCRAKMSMFMHAAGNADMCLRRQNIFYGFTEMLEMCGELSSSNIHYVLPTLKDGDKADIFLLTTRMDSFSAFSVSLGGDNSVLTSLIPILLVANAIGGNREYFENRAREKNRQLLFSFLNGESLGYIGSSRMAFDMLRHQFPRKMKNYGKGKTGATITFDDIGFFAEIEHLGSPRNNLFFHVDGENYPLNIQKIDRVKNTIAGVLSSSNINANYVNISENAQLPPSSYQSFLRHNRSVPGFVLSADSDHYALEAVDSVNDIRLTAGLESADALETYFTAVAKSILSAVTSYIYDDAESASKDYKFNSTFAKQLIECFFNKKWNCTYFKKIVPNYEENFHSIRNFYIGTKGQDSTILHLIEAILVQSLGDTHATPNVKTGDQCETLNPGQSLYNYIWAYNEAADREWCYRTSMFTTKAKSPVFEEGFDMKMLNYSSWVESVWDAHKLEVYLEGAHYTTPHLFFCIAILIFAIYLTCLDWTMINGQIVQRVVENGRNTAVRYQSIPTSAGPSRNEEVVFDDLNGN